MERGSKFLMTVALLLLRWKLAHGQEQENSVTSKLVRKAGYVNHPKFIFSQG